MRGEIIAIGDELTSGRVLNTTSCLATRRLFAAGHQVLALTTIGDEPQLIGSTLKAALDRSEFVIVTGGLGPTNDDLTNEAVAEALDRPAALNHDVLAAITEKNSGRQAGEGSLLGMLEKLAWLPTGAVILKPGFEMAGHLIIHDNVPIFFLPGVPHEMKELLNDCVLDELAARDPRPPGPIWQELYRAFGLSETEINQRCLPLAAEIHGLAIGYYPVYPEIHVSLTLKTRDAERTRQADAALREALGVHLFATGEDSMEAVVGELLRGKGKSLAVAESCTGGQVAASLTSITGSSEYFVGGVVAYSNELKEKFLGVETPTLEKHGAVSQPTARAMAIGIRNRTGADIGVSITGIAGPGGGSEEKPVGTVCFGLATASGASDFRCQFRGRRWQIQAMSTYQALDLVRRHLLDILPETE